MNINVNLAKDDKEREVFRLTNIVAREVSIVDRPANMRPFLLVKSEGAQGAELEADGMGGFRVKAAPPVAASESNPEPVATEKADDATQSEAPASIEVSDDIVTASLAPLDTTVVEKVGRKLASKREQAIRQAVELLLSVLEDTSKAVERVLGVNATLTHELSKANASMASLRKEHETLKARHVEVVRAVSKARSVQKSNVLPSEEHREAGPVEWPSDLNA